MLQIDAPALARRVARSMLVAAVLVPVTNAAQPAAAAQPANAAAAAQPFATAASAASPAAIASVDLAGTWSFTPSGRATTTIAVPGGGWYKQGFTDVNEAVYSRSVQLQQWTANGGTNQMWHLRPTAGGLLHANQQWQFIPS